MTPPRDCPLCPRLVAFRHKNRDAHPAFHNAPVGLRGDPDAPLLIIGLAPGLRGANRTGVAFSGDDSGVFLFAALSRVGLATADGETLTGCAIVNAVACVPPGNAPVAAEIAACRPYLDAALARDAGTLLTLGTVAHSAVIRTLGGRQRAHPFGHARETVLAGRRIVSAYHPSRYNVQTRRLTAVMLDDALSMCTAGDQSVSA